MAAKEDLTRGPVLLSISLCTVAFAFATCLLRFCVRKRISNNVGMDDYAMAAASVVAFIGTIFSIIEGVSMSDSPHALEFDWLGQPWFMMGATMAKITICLFFIRLVGSEKQWRILLGVQISLMALVNFAFSLTTNLQCRPLEKLWDPNVLGVCWDPKVQQNIGYFQGALSVFWWLFLSLFPVMIARDLEMHRRMRWPFYFLSSLSLMAGIFATVRTYETSQAVPGVYTFDTFFAAILSILEQNVGIVAANILPMGPLFSSRQRAAIRAESRMSNHTSGGSNALRTRGRGRGGNRSDSRASSLKRNSMLIIEGPRESTFSETSSTRILMLRDPDAASVASTTAEGAAAAAAAFWPRGIIKTVEVEVVEEDIADIERAAAAQSSRLSRMSIVGGADGTDWAQVLRQGPPPSPQPGSRGPSRLA